MASTNNQEAQITRYDSATDLIRHVGHALYQREEECNVILPLAQKLQHRASFSNSQYIVTTDMPVVDDFWLVVRSMAGEVEFVLSCTNGPLGAYPIFIWCGRPVSTMSRTFVAQRMSLLSQALLANVPSSKRVFSVFAPTVVTQAFAVAWSSITKFIPAEEPWYHATFSSVTASTLSELAPTAVDPPKHTLRPARAGDETGVAYLCYEFALTGEPFTLSEAGARSEAQWLISQGQAYVCEVEGTIVCLVAVTRSSTNHATITKVVTHPKFGRQGWAKRLVRDVCNRMLHNERKRSVLLYVALGNRAAEKTYRSVGFSGIMGDAQVPNMDTEWMEIGFDGADLGHW